MDYELMLKAQDEAERFIESVQVALEEKAKSNSKSDFIYGMNAATVKRRSMDLTRALSKLRQGEK